MADDNGEVKKSSNGKGLLIVLTILITILLVAVLGLGYLILIDKKSDKNSTQTSTQTTEAISTDASFKADVNDLVLNLTDSKGREKMMKLSFSIKSNDPTIATIVDQYKAEITDTVISLVGSTNSEELLTVGGKNLLKNELVTEINAVINNVAKSNRNVVSTILFTTFVIK